MLPIVETCLTLSGEAPIPGKPVFLVRFSHCNLSCTYCDTPHREEINEEISREELIRRIKEQTGAYPGLAVLFTGGEPLLGDRGKTLPGVARELNQTRFFIETNGTIPVPGDSPENFYYVMDWKSESSGARIPFCMDNLGRLRSSHDCIKFVVHAEDLPHLAEKIKIIHEYNPALRVFVSPQFGSITPGELWNWILEHKLNVTLSLQLHKLIWGDRRGV